MAKRIVAMSIFSKDGGWSEPVYFQGGSSGSSGGAIDPTELPTATSEIAGILKLYTGSGSNTDGTMTQQAITNAIQTAVNTATASITAQIPAAPGEATSTTAGITKLYNSIGNQIDGAVTPNAVDAVISEVQSQIPTIPTASEGTAGVTRLYNGSGNNTNGTMTQAAIGQFVRDSINGIQGVGDANETTSGTVKLYSSTNGTNTDGVPTQAAIKESLDSKFGTVTVGGTSMSPSAAYPSLNFVAGSQVDLSINSTTRTVTIGLESPIPTETATTSSNGLMSSADKSTLNALNTKSATAPIYTKVETVYTTDWSTATSDPGNGTRYYTAEINVTNLTDAHPTISLGTASNSIVPSSA